MSDRSDQQPGPSEATPPGSGPAPLRVGFVPGVTPDKWRRRWEERPTPSALELVVVSQADQLDAVLDGSVDMCLARDLPGRDDLHRIELYDEQPVVVASRDHPVAAYDAVPLADLAGEIRLQVPPLSPEDAVATAAAGTGFVVMPMSLARLHHRKDVVAVPVADPGPGAEVSSVSLVWRRDLDDDRIQTFVGVVRGRTARSSRGSREPSPPKSPTKPSPKQRTAKKRAAGGRSAAARSGSGRRPRRGGAR